MTTAEIIEIQDEIIRAQSEIIKRLADAQEQTEAFDKEMNRIEELKRKMGDTDGL